MKAATADYPPCELVGTIVGTESEKPISHAFVRTGFLSGEGGAERQNRTADTVIFSHVLYQLSYLGLARTYCAAGDEQLYHRPYSSAGFPWDNL